MSHFLYPPQADVDRLVAAALAEDVTPLGDLSSSVLTQGSQATITMVAREAGVLAGALCVDRTMHFVDPAVNVDWHVGEGAVLAEGSVMATFSGSYASLLTAERTALNFVSHLSGIATMAAKWVDLAGGRVTVWDTRKTLPGYRSLQKAAIRAGGAKNHRGNLSDWIMLKDNHLATMSVADGVAKARSLWPGRTIHVEADTQEMALEAIKAGANIILLDNFTPAALTEVVKESKAYASANNFAMPLLEASGGITFDTLDAYADTGVDLVSSGSLTNSVTALDIGFDM